MLSDAQKQIALNKAGYGPLKVDGIIGPRTIAAVKRFQSLNKLMPDGIIGPKTERALQRFYDAMQPAPVKPPVATKTGNVFSDKGMAMLARSEGIRTRAYRDSVGVTTIGIGATWGSETFRDWWNEHRPGKEFDMSAVLTLDEINAVTRQMIDEEYGAAVNEALGNKKVPQHAFDAAVHFVYNTGKGAVGWRWFKPFAKGDYAGAADIMRTYLKPPELKSRREKEAALMRHGTYA